MTIHRTKEAGRFNDLPLWFDVLNVYNIQGLKLYRVPALYTSRTCVLKTT